MQRIRKILGAALMGGLFLSVTAPTQAQTYYVQSSNFRSVPVAQSVVTTQSFQSFGSPFQSFGSPRFSNYSRAQALNDRRSAPAVYFQASYSPESEDYYPAISSRAVAASQPTVSSRVVSSRAFVATQPRFYSHPVTTYGSVVSSQPVVYSDPVLVSQPVVSSRAVVTSQPVIYSDEVVESRPVRVIRSVVASPRVIREEAECRSRSLGARRLESEPTVTVSESNGRRVKTYRYEYELDHRPGRVTIELDSND